MESSKTKFYQLLADNQFDGCLKLVNSITLSNEKELVDSLRLKFDLYQKKNEKLISSYLINEILRFSEADYPELKNDLLVFLKLSIETESSLTIDETVQSLLNSIKFDFDLQFHLIWLDVQKGNFQKVIDDIRSFRKGKVIDPEIQHNTLILLAYCFFKMNRIPESNLAFLKARHIEINLETGLISDHYHFLLAQFYLNKNRDLARTILREINQQELSDKNIDLQSEANNLLAETYKEENDLNKAFEIILEFEELVKDFQKSSNRSKFNQFTQIMEFQSELSDKVKKIFKEKIKQTEKQIGEYQQRNREYNKEDYVFSSNEMRRIFTLVNLLHQSRDLPVLIEGETGTGKEIIAKAIHFGESPINLPFIKINCAAINPTLFESELFGYDKGAFTGASVTGKVGKFELAQGGTIFLDEIGELTLAQQAKLLRVIQEREVFRVGSNKNIKLDIRIICATNKNLEVEIQKGNFRSDLYFRLNTGEIHLPPLRERKEEIIALVNLYLNKISRQRNKRFNSISDNAQKALKEYSWPGNVRELINVVERAVLLHDDEVLKSDFLDLTETKKGVNPDEIRISVPLNKKESNLKLLKQKTVQQVLAQLNNNKAWTVRFFKTYPSKISRILKMKY